MYGMLIIEQMFRRCFWTQKHPNRYSTSLFYLSITVSQIRCLSNVRLTMGSRDEDRLQFSKKMFRSWNKRSCFFLLLSSSPPVCSYYLTRNLLCSPSLLLSLLRMYLHIVSVMMKWDSGQFLTLPWIILKAADLHTERN